MTLPASAVLDVALACAIHVRRVVVLTTIFGVYVVGIV